MSEGGIERLMYITRSPVGTYSEKVVKFATQVTWRFTSSHDTCLHLDARVEEGRNSVYEIARKLQKTVFVVMSQTHAEKLYAKILL